jgi:hypothetical protein
VRGRKIWLAALLIIPGWATAHPVDELVQSAYLTLTPGAVMVEVNLTIGPQVAGPIIALLDADGTGDISAAEADAFAQTLLAQTMLQLDGQAMDWQLDDVIAPSLGFLATGNAILTIRASAPRPDVIGPHVLHYDAGFAPATTLHMANIFLRGGGGWDYAVTGQDHSVNGAGLTVQYVVSRD